MEKKEELTEEQIRSLIMQTVYLKELQDYQNDAVFRHQLIQAIDRNTAAMSGLMQALKEGLSLEEEPREEKVPKPEPVSPKPKPYTPAQYEAYSPKKKDEEEEDEEEEEDDKEEEDDYRYVPKKSYKGK